MLLLFLNAYFLLFCLAKWGIMKVNYSISKIPPNLPLQREACRCIAACYATPLNRSNKLCYYSFLLVFLCP